MRLQAQKSHGHLHGDPCAGAVAQQPEGLQAEVVMPFFSGLLRSAQQPLVLGQ
jgi:hypothetical protein